MDRVVTTEKSVYRFPKTEKNGRVSETVLSLFRFYFVLPFWLLLLLQLPGLSYFVLVFLILVLSLGNFSLSLSVMTTTTTTLVGCIHSLSPSLLPVHCTIRGHLVVLLFITAVVLLLCCTLLSASTGASSTHLITWSTCQPASLPAVVCVTGRQ